MKLYKEKEAKKLRGNVELVSTTEYSLSEAKRRLQSKLPKDMSPGGTPIIIELTKEPGQRAAKHLAAWWVK